MATNPFPFVPPVFSPGITPGVGGSFTAPATTAPVPFTPATPFDPTTLDTSAASGNSRIDTALSPYLNLGLERAAELFFGPGPSLYPGQTYATPDQALLDSLAARESLARGTPTAINAGMSAYENALAGTRRTASGEFLGSNPYLDSVIASATRPITEGFMEQALPGISSQYSAAGRYGSGAMARATGQATEKAGRAIGDIASNIAYSDYARERGLMESAVGREATLGAMAPSFYEASFLPSMKLAEVGTGRMALDEPAIADAIRRYEYEQKLPYNQLQGFLSAVYGTPMGSSNLPSTDVSTNKTAEALGFITTLAGAFPEARKELTDWLTGVIP